MPPAALEPGELSSILIVEYDNDVYDKDDSDDNDNGDDSRMEILYRESHIKQPCYTSEPTGPRERVLLDEHDLGRAVPGQRHAVPWSSSRSSWISLATGPLTRSGN